MSRKRKEPIKEIFRDDTRYTIFDDDKLSIQEKEISFFRSLEDKGAELKTHNHTLEYKQEFINITNYNNFLDDVKKIVQYSKYGKSNVDIDLIIDKVNSFNWEVEKIKDYLQSVEVSHGNTILSYLHIQNFTETLVKYPYPLEKSSIYQKHITPFLEIDFKQDLSEVKKYIERVYNTLDVERNNYESDKKSNFTKNKNFNFGDCLFTFDALSLNYTNEKIAELINLYREDLIFIDRKQVGEYKKILTNLNIDVSTNTTTTQLDITFI